MRIRQWNSVATMSLEEVEPESYDYEQTLVSNLLLQNRTVRWGAPLRCLSVLFLQMYGKFTSELRDFARNEAVKMRRERAERRLEEQGSQTASGGMN